MEPSLALFLSAIAIAIPTHFSDEVLPLWPRDQLRELFGLSRLARPPRPRRFAEELSFSLAVFAVVERLEWPEEVETATPR